MPILTDPFSLSSLLLIGAVVGAQIGTKAMGLLRGEQIRFLLAIIIIIVASILIGNVLVTPEEAFIVETYKEVQ